MPQPQLETDWPHTPRLEGLQVGDMRDKLRWRARHNQTMFREDFVAFAKDCDLSGFGFIPVTMRIVRRCLCAAFTAQYCHESEAGQ